MAALNLALAIFVPRHFTKVTPHLTIKLNLLGAWPASAIIFHGNIFKGGMIFHVSKD